ncbi:glutathione S-transferase [Aspergillus bombycis]|uniref:Glutathione S-transferase n=1 Tax=Aspergillus bombycis TaxID=109264 RepID=A0A1F8A4S8_9EURO|nr:glutathione S-transferase [Aspergillus bombycis]OGM46726.1 glutathione S-transferase [Aspergillus bombycis]
MTSTSDSTPLTLYRGLPGTGTYSWSPFVIKLEVRLRFAGIPYRVEAGSIRNAPRGKVPYISIPAETLYEDGSKPASPVVMGDSTMITKTFIEKGLTKDLNANLSGSQKLQDMGLKALLEDKLYWYNSYEKWVLNYYTMRDVVLAAFPWPVRVVIGLLAYSKVTRTLTGQGTMLFSTEEIGSLRGEIWERINGTLVEARSRHGERGGQGPFWVSGGEEPTEADATLFGFIVSGLVCYAAPNTQKVVRGYPAVVDYARRIHDKYFPDYALWA